MSDSLVPKSRSTCLSDEGLDALNSAIQNRWDGTKLGKLTRKARAEMLGVSERTVDNILAQRRVDRATLVLVFTSLGIDWKPSFEVPSGVCENGGGPSQEVHCSRAFLKSRYLLPTGVLALAVALGSAWFLFSQRARKEQWNESFERLFARGMAAYHRGDYKQAERDLLSAEQLAHSNLEGGRLSSAHRGLGDLAAERGDLSSAKAHLEKALDLRKLFGDSTNEPAIHESLGSVEARLQNFAAAKKHFLIAMNGFREIKIGDGVAEAQRGLGTVAFLEGEDTDALAWFAAAKSTLQGKETSAMFMDVRAREALVLSRQGEAAKAEATLTECLKFWTWDGHPRWIAKTKLQLAQVKAARGDISTAIQLLKESREGYRKVEDRAGEQDAIRQITLLSVTKRR